jgi:hypothetical protein
VIPFYHTGMEGVRFGRHTVTVLFRP